MALGRARAKYFLAQPQAQLPGQSIGGLAA
jgi:hypothetical protein